MDVLTEDQRRRAMQGNVGRGTRPELVVLGALLEAGLVARPAEGRQFKGDIWVYNPRLYYQDTPQVIVFVHGCFWHGCPLHYREPASNQSYWLPKIKANMERDKSDRIRARSLGFSVHTVWEHDARPGSVRIKQLIASCRRELGG